MTSKEKKKFESWYQEQVDNNYEFNFKYEILTYCQSDVDILRQAMESFRVSFMEVGGFDPLRHSLTISSATMSMYRLKHLIPGTLGIVPRGGYRSRDKQSFIALQWLDFEQHKLKDIAKITTAENSREVRVMGRPVDGYTEISSPDGSIEKHIWEFWGCFWHQCVWCYSDTNSRERLRNDAGEDRYENTRRLTNIFKKNGYIVHEMWECQFREECQTNPTVKTYFEQHPTTRSFPLQLRDALCGGRTSAVRSYKKADVSKGEKIKFFDICSEYPYINLTFSYVKGHPKIFLQGDPNMPPIDTWNGVAKVTVSAPESLFLPVLPYRCCSKLMFPLCKTCAETQNQDVCTHTATKDRAFTGTWCANELQLAVNKGYKILSIHELYQYPEVEKYDPVAKTGGLFSGYVRENMALKYEASGWPTHIKTDEDREQYVKAIFERDGIVIRKERVEKNPGKRTLAKLILNSFWGKMGEKTLRPKTVFVFDYGELIRLVCFVPVEDMDESLKTTSLIHAAQTTAGGRELLYKYLDIVGERCIYNDTDSVCFLSVPGQPEPELGPYLGQMTDQLSEDFSEGSYCCEFAYAGAKNYSFKVCVGGDPAKIRVVTKVRGLSINSSCEDTVTFDTLKHMVLSDEKIITNIDIPSQIARLPGWRIVTRPSSKKWQVCLNKRRRIHKEKTEPYGFKGTLLDDEDYEILSVLENLADNT
ncbi:DNA polymerase [Frankliniella fusca]|uniref:DNA-directed DNA polymerase n=1 Tax=Frankliniella fusca TaxID=407009 RepID=A0AAE1LDT7_9NEOP|nr:DNA polymerase [Frankliniella fusca]